MSGHAMVQTQKQNSAPVNSGILQRKTCSCGRPVTTSGQCTECRKKRLSLQRRAVNQAGPEVAPPIVNEVLRSPGRPLDPMTRRFMESRFGYDFSKVKVHTGNKEATSAQGVEALAYTFGNHIVFDQGQYRPQTPAGRRLLAHELTHVVQQSSGSLPSLSAYTDYDSDNFQDPFYEQEAQSVSERVEGSQKLRIRQNSLSPKVQRAAPAAAAIGAALGRCALGALIGVAVDLGLQALIYSWRRWTWRFWELTVDYCSLFLSAVLGCLGGIALPAVARWVGARLGPRLGGLAGTLLGRILIWLATRAGIAVPKGLTKLLLKLGCISAEQADVVHPGISSEEEVAIAPGSAAGETMPA